MSLIQRLLFLTACGLLGLAIGTMLGQCAAHAGPIRVAVIDTGLEDSLEPIPLCEDGYKDFTGGSYSGSDPVAHHGTNVAALITLEAGASAGRYCLTMFKIFTQYGFDMVAYMRALDAIAKGKYDFVNMSFSGPISLNFEIRAIKSLLDRGTVVVVAAGNDSKNLDTSCNSYPACVDPRIVVVSAHDVPTANTGKVVDVWTSGARQAGGGYIMSGTSQATARTTGVLVRKKLQGRK